MSSSLAQTCTLKYIHVDRRADRRTPCTQTCKSECFSIDQHRQTQKESTGMRTCIFDFPCARGQVQPAWPAVPSCSVSWLSIGATYNVSNCTFSSDAIHSKWLSSRAFSLCFFCSSCGDSNSQPGMPSMPSVGECPQCCGGTGFFTYPTPLVLAGSESEGPEHLDFTRTQRTKVGPSPTADFAHSVSKSDAAVLAPWLLVPVEQGRDPCFLKACRLFKKIGV